MKPHDEIFRAMASDPGAQQDLLKICAPDLAQRFDQNTRTQLLQYLFYAGRKKSTNALLTAAKKAEYTLRGGKSVMTIAQELERRGREKGLREGREEGLKEGRVEAARTVARNLLQRGLPVDVIAETTGLAEEDVIALRQE